MNKALDQKTNWTNGGVTYRRTIPPNSFVNGALSEEIENGSKMSKNIGLSYGSIFFWRKTKCVGARISGGGPQGRGCAQGGWAHPRLLWPGGVAHGCVLSANNS